MRVIPAALHRILDFVTIAAFALAPSLFAWTGVAANLSYLLAAVHLAMTLLTRFSPEKRRPLSLTLHGTVESIVGTSLVALPWLVNWDGSPRIVFMAAGVVILLARVLSEYRLAASTSVAWPASERAAGNSK